MKMKSTEIKKKCKRNQGSNNKSHIINDSGPRPDQIASRYAWNTHNIGKFIMNIGSYLLMIGNIHNHFSLPMNNFSIFTIHFPVFVIYFQSS